MTLATASVRPIVKKANDVPFTLELSEDTDARFTASALTKMYAFKLEGAIHARFRAKWLLTLNANLSHYRISYMVSESGLRGVGAGTSAP